MTVATPLPQVEQPISAASSGTPVHKPGERKRWIITGALLLFVIAIVANLATIAVMAHRGEPALIPTARAPVQTIPVPAAPQAAPPGLATTFGAGRFIVGTDIAAGTYRSNGPSGHLDCYWERLKDTNGGTDSIIANNLGKGPATVTIDEHDGAFQTRWCNTWTKIN
jgi:hypothetical protein